MTSSFKELPQNAPERIEYAHALRALKPILDNLPKKIVTIDGRAGAGKTTLGRFLAWRFNITLVETDLFLIRNTGKFLYRIDHLIQIVNARMKNDRPIIMEGIVALRILRDLKRASDFHIRVGCDSSEGSSATEKAWSAYEIEFPSNKVAQLLLNLPVISDT
jgi:cytidylate kinase